MLTKQELIEVLDIYIAPIYNMIGAAVALFVGLVAVWFVLVPFIRKLRE